MQTGVWKKQSSSLHLHLQPPLLFKWECVDAPPRLTAHGAELAKSWCGEEKKKKKSSCPSPDSVSSWLSPSPLCHSERLIRTCHRSNEYHLNCFVYGSEFGCRFNLCMYSSSGAWRGRPAGERQPLMKSQLWWQAGRSRHWSGGFKQPFSHREHDKRTHTCTHMHADGKRRYDECRKTQV